MRAQSFNLHALWHSLNDDERQAFADRSKCSTGYLQNHVTLGTRMPRPFTCERIAKACRPHVSGPITGKDVCLWCYDRVLERQKARMQH